MELKKRKTPQSTYWMRRALVVLLPVGCVLFFWPKAEQAEPPRTTQYEASSASYSIEEKSYDNDADMTRIVYDVVVQGEPDTEQLQSISHQVIDDVTATDQFQAALLRFYDDAAYIGTEPPLGEAVFAPNGDFSSGRTVALGDYDAMDYGWQLREKEWTTRLGPDEIKIWGAWHRLYEQLDSEDPDVNAKVTQRIATTYDLDPKAVQQIVLKQHVWQAL